MFDRYLLLAWSVLVCLIPAVLVVQIAKELRSGEAQAYGVFERQVEPHNYWGAIMLKVLVLGVALAVFVPHGFENIRNWWAS